VCPKLADFQVSKLAAPTSFTLNVIRNGRKIGAARRVPHFEYFAVDKYTIFDIFVLS